LQNPELRQWSASNVAGRPSSSGPLSTRTPGRALPNARRVDTEEIIGLLASDPQAIVHVSVESGADFPASVSDQLKRAVSENPTSLGFKNTTWE